MIDAWFARIKEIAAAAGQLEAAIDRRLDRAAPATSPRSTIVSPASSRSWPMTMARRSRRWYRHVFYGWNIYSLYDGQLFPGLADALQARAMRSG